MAEIKNLGGQLPPVNQNAAKIADESAKALNQQSPNVTNEKAVGRDSIGQPIGLPGVEQTSQSDLMPSVITGRDPSQLVAAEKMRSNGGHSATEVLLGLNQQPSTVGILLAPPGNLDALRHLSPAMRRNTLRNLLSKQRGHMQQIVAVMRDEQEQKHSQQDQENQDSTNEFVLSAQPADKMSNYSPRNLRDLEATTKMLDLLDELLGLQDYTLSQIGTFSQG